MRVADLDARQRANHLDAMTGSASTSLPRVPTVDCRTSTIPCTIKPSWLPVAGVSVWAIRKSISARFLPGRPWALKKCTTTFGWSALWIMIWATSIWKLGCSNRSKIHSVQKCYLCLRYVVSPMSPGRTYKRTGGEGGIRTPVRVFIP